MINVSLNIHFKNGQEEIINTEMPFLPESTSKIGLYVLNSWDVFQIGDIIHEFNTECNFVVTEINLYQE
jgi:hypothetical protein